MISADSGKNLLQKAELTAAAILTAVVILPHLLFFLRAGPLWRDEVNSVNLATLPSLSQIFHSLRWDSFPVLFSLLLRLWIAVFGSADAALRFFGLLIGLAVVAVLWLNARLLNKTVPLFSLSLFAFNPLAIQVGDSIRPYGLGIVLLLLTFAFIWKLTDKGGAAYFVAAAVSAVLSVHCLYQNAVILAAIILAATVVALKNKRKKPLAFLIIIAALAALSLLPYATSLKLASDWAVILQLPRKLISYSPQLYELLTEAGKYIAWLWIAVLLLAVAVVFYLLHNPEQMNRTKPGKDALIFVAIAAFAAAAGFLAFLWFTKIPPQPWYYLLVMAVVAVALDCIFACYEPAAFLRMLLAAAIVALSVNAVLTKVGIRRTNVDLIAARLFDTAAEDDLILFNPWYISISFNRYYEGPAEVLLIPPVRPVKMHRYDLVKKLMASDEPLGPVFAAVKNTLSSGNNVWVVGAVDFILEKAQEPPALPPAPNTSAGWHYGTYMTLWRLQLGSFIQTHCLKGDLLANLDDDNVSRYEKCQVIMLSGWTDQPRPDVP